MSQIDRASKLPLYHQLYELLRGDILDGRWQPGDLLLSESEMVERYQISRTTVRQVLDMLVNEGLIYRQRGRGTFVAQPSLEQGLQRIVSFTQDMRHRGLEPGTQILFSGIVPATKEIAKALEIGPGVEIARIDRLRLAGGDPLSIEESHLVHHTCTGVLDGDYRSNSLREALERDYGLRIVRARQVIRAVLATSKQAGLLSIPNKSALLLIERVSYAEGNLPLEFLRIYYRADRYSLYSELQG